MNHSPQSIYADDDNPERSSWGHHLFELENMPCETPECTHSSSLLSVSTHWSQVLFVMPETVGETEEAFKNRRLPRVDFPLSFSITSTVNDNNSALKDAHPVDYRLVGRVKFQSVASHYVSELYIGDRLYEYDDMRTGEQLVDLGRAEDALKPDRTVRMIVYHRASSSHVSFVVAWKVNHQFY